MESKGDGVGLSIPSLMILLTIVGLNLFDEPKLKSNRPPPAQHRGESFSDQQVPARLWQDPFGAVSAFAGSGSQGAKAPAPAAGSLCQDGTPPRSILCQVQERLERGERLTILPVMLPGQHYAESTEARIRIRYAVVSGLDVAGYTPADPAHLGYVQSPDPQRFGSTLPYEWFSAAPPATATATVAASVLVVWLNDDAFRTGPVGRLTDLMDRILPKLPGQAHRVRVLGPGSSDGLAALLNEVKSDQGKPYWSRPDKGLEFAMYSPNATAADAELLSGAGIAGPTTVEDYVGPLVRFKRAIADDTALSTQIATELVSRGLNRQRQDASYLVTRINRNLLNTLSWWRPPSPSADAKGAHGGALSKHVVLLAEWDTTYGRSLPLSVANALSNAVTPTRDLTKAAMPPPYPWIHYLSYMRGLDGDTPTQAGGAPAKAPDTQADKKAADRAPDPAARAEGQEQLDYVRRLAHDLVALELELRNKPKRERIFAIGILGSDVHDKLLILQALRPLFPGAAFFTTDLDARLLDPSQGQWTRGLIVSSAFGLQHTLAGSDPIAARHCQWPIPPFRSSYQTAYFFATRSALSENAEDPCALASPDPQAPGVHLTPVLYEVGRTGPVRLDGPTGIAPAAMPWISVGLTTLALFLLLLSMYRLDWIRALKARPLRFLTRRPIASAAVGLVALAMVWWVRDDLRLLACPGIGGADCIEPFSLTNGISIWAPLYLQTLALVLSVAFWIYVFLQVRSNAQDLEARYFSESAPGTADAHQGARGELADYARAGREAWTRISSGLAGAARRGYGLAQRLRTPGAVRAPTAAPTAPGPATADALTIWRRYRQGVTVPRRLLRVLFASTLFYILVLSLFQAIGGGASNPVRGTRIAELYGAIRMLDIFAMAMLAFGVLDTALKCRGFITDLARAAVGSEPLAWPEAVIRRFREGEIGEVQNIHPWIALRVIAEHADTVARLVIYPLIILAVLVVARLSWFDTVTMPVSILVTYIVFGFYILLAAWSMQSAANAAKRAIWDYYARCQEREENRPTPNERMIAQYKCLGAKVASMQDGAFKPLKETHLVRAALLPFGALGIGLLDLFG
jgi:hypothetical protein